MVPTEETAKASEEKQGVSAPAITLPKGGGAIHGMGEKFAANPVTGTGSMSIPIATSPGRSGFGPQLALSYDSGAGNGIFGLGWSLGQTTISRKTDKGLPRYLDNEESDVFLFSGAEDLVPFIDTVSGKRKPPDSLLLDGKSYLVYRYRPRIEGSFALIERWVSVSHAQDCFWRTISKDNITNWFGRSELSRIYDPSNPGHIFQWLLDETHDDKGNIILYSYLAENSANIKSLTNESNRTDLQRTVNRYLKRIQYGNTISYLDQAEWPLNKWMFEVVFDYGDHDLAIPMPRDDEEKDAAGMPKRPWARRQDPFSAYRAGFEVRTYRLCQRVLMFHHFPGEQGVEANCLVRSTNFTYSYEDPASIQTLIFSFLLAATQTGHKRNGADGYLSKSLPPVEFEYTQAIINETIQEVDPVSLENLPYGLDGSNYQWVDLDGEGLSGILTEQADGWFYKRNISANQQVIDPNTNAIHTVARFNPVERVTTKPNSTLTAGHSQFLDLAGDGQTDLVTMEAPVRGFYERTQDEEWEPFRTFESWPNIDNRDPNLKFIDLTGDGHADILISEDQAFIWHASLAEAGFEPARRVQQVFDDEKGPHLVFANGMQSIYLADMSGDGLTDIVRVRNGEVCYWPNLGYCRFGAKVTMDNSPWFDNPDIFDQRRIRLADIDGSGATDILYLGGKGVQIYFNQSGNGWSKNRLLARFPHIDNLSSVETVDLLGNGTACLVWSSPLPGNARQPMRYIDLMGGQKPHLLIKTVNNLGAETRVEYAASTKFYLNDKLAGKPWITKLPFPVHCVEKVTVIDKWRKTSFSSTYSYHHGYFDGIEREFRGFGRVEQVDVEDYGTFANGNKASPYITDDQTLYQPPVKTITWFHTGAALDRQRILTQFQGEYFPHSLAALPTPVSIDSVFKEKPLPEPDFESLNLTAEEWREALRACKGMTLRQEVYELDVDALQPEGEKPPKQIPVRLFSTATHNCNIRRLQPKGGNQHAVFLVTESEALSYHYELDLRPVTLPPYPQHVAALTPDPRIAHTLNLSFDEYGNIQQSVSVAYPRLPLSAGLVTEILADNPAAYYRLHESPGATTAVDSSGHANHGAYSGIGVTLGALGLAGGDTAAQFDGLGSGRIIVPDNELLNPGNITVEALISWSGPNGFQQRILEKSFGPDWRDKTDYGLSILDDEHVRAEIATESGDYRVTSKSAVTLGTATHLAMTYDGSTLAIYINGVLDSSQPASGDIRSTFGSSQLGIGNQVERDRAFKGIIDEVSVYNKALAANRIRAHAAGAVFLDPGLGAHIPLIQSVQNERHVAYSETHYTKDAIDPAAGTAPVQYYRLPVPCEVQTYELTGFTPAQGFYFDLSELRSYHLSDTLPNQGSTLVVPKLYHELPQDTSATMRLVEHARTLFFEDDPTVTTRFLKEPLSLGTLGKLGLTYENYKLALTEQLLGAVFTNTQLNAVVPSDAATPQTVLNKLNQWQTSGYLSGTDATDKFGQEAAGQYWIRSGIAGFASDATLHFYLPEEYTDPFGNKTTLTYDGKYDLFVQSSKDALDNVTQITQFDYRVLAPAEMEDINGNLTEACFDVLGMVITSAVKGKGTEADNLRGYTDTFANPDLTAVLSYFDLPPLTANQADARFSSILGNATSRFLYHFGERMENGKVVWGDRPAGACTVVREQHVASLAAGDPPSPLQIAFECSDGMGAVLMKRSQAEPEQTNGPLRWIVSGKTVLNNKGKPVKQYEPYFSTNAKCCAEGDEHEEVGVTPLMYYDAAGRLVRTEMPDGTFSRVEFSPWHVRGFDANDTVLESKWYADRGSPDPSQPLAVDLSGRLTATPEFRAAWLAAQHADTPSLTILDSLGHEVIAIAHNRVEDANGSHEFNGKRYRDERYLTFTKLDAEGKPLWIRDARGNLVMQYITPIKPTRAAAEPNQQNIEAMPTGSVPCYDIAGNLLFQHSMDAGDRWTINDAAGKPMFAWDSRDNLLMSSYDALHRPTKLELKNLDHPDWVVVGLTQYGEGTTGDEANNRRGKPYRSFDQSGVVTNQEFDFKGNALHVSRRLANDYNVDTDWKAVLQLPLDQEPGSLLMPETFTQLTEYDALNRMTRQYNWHRAGKPVAVYEPGYNARGLLLGEDLTVGANKTAVGHSGGNKTSAIQNIRYDAKGQRLSITYDNNVTTQYTYDPNTFRLLTLLSTRPNKPELQDLSYTYDPSGNITEIFDAAVPTEFFNNAVIEPRKRYFYDALYRLIEATGREHAGQLIHDAQDNWNDCPYRVDYGANISKAWRNYTQRYTYDSVGNILVMQHILIDTVNRWTRQYQYATDSNRLLSTGMGAAPANHYATAPTLEYRYSYDVHGSMTSLPHLPTMDWNYTDHLGHISRAAASQGTNPDGCPNSSLEAWYRYDAAKQRTRKRVKKQGGLVEEHFYLGGLEWYRRTLNDALVEEIETLHLFDGEQRLLMVDQVIESPRGKSVLYRYTLSNHLGSSTVEVDENADIISYEDYHPYGTTAYQSGRNAAEVKLKRYRYTGMERDEESGLGNHGARSYSSFLGRWISPDPSGVANDIDLYRYCACNPIGARDLTGLAGAPPHIPNERPPNSTGIGAEAHRDILSRLALLMAVMRNPAIPMPYQAKVEEPTQPGGSKPGPNQGLNPGQVDLIVFETKYAGLISGESSHVLYAHFYELKPFFEGWNDSRLRPENTKTTWDRQLQNYLTHDNHVEAPGEFYDTKFGTILERYRAIVETPFPVPKGGFTRWYKLRLPPGPDGQPIPGLIEYTYVDRSAAEEEAAEKEAATAAAAAKAQEAAKKQAEEAFDKLLPVTQAASSFFAELSALVESVAPAVGTGALIAVDTLAAPITFGFLPQILNDPQKSEYPGI